MTAEQVIALVLCGLLALGVLLTYAKGAIVDKVYRDAWHRGPDTGVLEQKAETEKLRKLVASLTEQVDRLKYGSSKSDDTVMRIYNVPFAQECLKKGCIIPQEEYHISEQIVDRLKRDLAAEAMHYVDVVCEDDPLVYGKRVTARLFVGRRSD